MSNLVIDTENNKEFTLAMNELVSNDKLKREEGLNLTKKILLKKITNFEEVYKKIWKSLFYFFWNVDKNQYQLQMAKKIASFIFKNEEEKELIDKHENWINIFINEFMRKFQSVDFLRSDKYLMLSDQIISTYLVFCLKNNNINSINKFPIYLENEIKNNNYNFSFQANIIRIISRFISYVFKNEEKNDNIKNFVNDKISIFYTNLLSLFFNIKDKREIKLFEETIIFNFINNLNSFGDKNIKNNIIDISKKFLEKNNNKLILLKKNGIDLLIKKLEDEKYEKEEKEEYSVDPVNKYIMEKNYTAKIRKSTYEKKKEKEEKRKKKTKEKKEKNKDKDKLNDKKQEEKKEEKNIKTKNKKNLENSEIIKEEIITLNNSEEENEKKNNIEKKKKNTEKKEIISDDELIEEEDEEMKEKNDDDDEENESEENNINLNEDEDFDDFNNEENEGEEIEEDELIEESFDEDEEEISDAYKNQIRNSQITKINNNNFLGKKIHNNNNKVKKRKVKYALENNVTNVYDKKKPIILTSKRKELLIGNSKKESLLRK